MTLASFFIFLVPVLAGSLIIHLLWPERAGLTLLLKLSLGMGLGLGLASILHFLILQIAPGRLSAFGILAGGLAALSMLVIAQERRRGRLAFKMPSLSRLQWTLLALNLVALVFASLVLFNLTSTRPQGAFDAWSIWNRAARFLYRDPVNWQATLSPELYWGTHADYPLLVPLNVAWAWEVVGMETQRVPMMQSAYFMYGSISLMFAAVGLARTWGQAGLASLVLMGTPAFLVVSYGLIADIQVAYFVLAASVLMYLHFLYKHPACLALAGVMAGLAAWTKNEGLLYAVVSVPVAFLALRRDGIRPFAWYLAGLAIPMAVVLYFKLALAPANDLFAESAGDKLAKLADLSRYWIVLKTLAANAWAFSGWPASIFVQLAVYSLIVRFNSPDMSPGGIRLPAAILGLQMLGYCFIYVLTPHGLEWHLATSFTRLILHLYPAVLFLFFCAVTAPETVFRGATVSKG